MKFKGKTDWILAVGSSGGLFFDTKSGQAEVVEPARTSDVVASVAALLKKHPLPRRSKVLVLTDSVFQQNLQLPRVQTNGLTDEELSSVITYEIEPFSSLSAENGLCAFVSLPGEGPTGSWDVVQVDRGVLGELGVLLRTAGCVLAGVSALPPGVALDDAASAGPVFAEISRTLAGGEVPFAIAVPPKESFIQGKAMTTGVLVTVLIALACAVHCLFLRQSVRRLRPEVAFLSAKAEENAALSAKADEFNRNAQSVVEDRRARAEAERKLKGVRGAMAGFLAALADSCGDDAVLSSVETGEREFSCKVCCYSATAENAAGFMKRFSELMASRGWTITPGALVENRQKTVTFSFTADFKPEFDAKEGK